MKNNKKHIIISLLALFLFTQNVSAKSVNFSFKGTKLKDFVISIADILQFTVTIDSRVNGKVNIESYKNISKKDLLNLFHSQLQINGFVALQTKKNMWRVIPANLAKMQPEIQVFSPYKKYNPNDIVTRTIPTSISAKNILPIIQPMVNSSVGSVFPYTSGASLVITDRISNINRIMDIIKKLEESAFQSHKARIIPLNYIKPSIMEKRLRAFYAMQSNEDLKSVSIVANDELNSLIITGSQFSTENALNLVRQMDVRTPQVLVEAIILEVEDSVKRNIGFDFLFTSGATSSLGYQAWTNTVEGKPLTAIARLLERETGINVMSTPSVVVSDNQEVVFLSGREVPIVTGTTQGSSTTSEIVKTYQRKDIGLTLKITPKITKDNTVIMKIFQEISSVDNLSETANDIVTKKRKITTNVIADNEQILSLGGLQDKGTREMQVGIPLLMDIPILGWFFGRRDTETYKRNLFILVRPTIISDKNSSAVLTKNSLKKNGQDIQKIKQEFIETTDSNKNDLPIKPQ